MSDEDEDSLKKRLTANSWMKSVDEVAKTRDATEKEPFASTATPQERAAGFIETTFKNVQRYAFEPDRIKVVVRVIDEKSMAVKLVSPNGDAEYVVMDRDRLRPMLGHSPVSSLEDLVVRYPIKN